MNRVEKLKEFLRKTPADSFLQHALALEYVKLGDETNAREVFEHLLKNDPDYLGSYYHLAKLYERIGISELAIRTYEAGMEKAKSAGDMHAMNELRVALEELND